MRQARLLRLASGAALHVSGTAGSEPVLFFHGVGGGAWSWEPQIAEFERDRHCYAWEARGHGAAARVEDAGLGDYFVDAREALVHVSAAEGPAWLAGHSMGGLLALALAAERPADVRGLMLVEPVYAPSGGTGHLSGPLGRLARLAVAPLVRSYARDGALARTLSRWMFERSFEDRERMERAWIAQRTQVPIEYPKMMYEAFDGPTNFRSAAFARDLAMPTLLAEGTVAARGPRFPELVRDLEHLGDAFSYIRLDGGHYLQLDRSAPRLRLEFREFVTRWSP